MATNWIYTGSLKSIISRERPDGSDHRSFPSGHSSTVFSGATVLDHHYGWKVAVPVWALAGMVGAARVQREKHHASDVIAGACIGYIVGRTTTRRADDPRPGSRQLRSTVAPQFIGTTRAVMINISD